MIENKLNYYTDMTNAALDKYFPMEQCNQSKIFEAARYSLLNSGKRLRPALLLEFYSLCGGEIEDAMPFACALEMIHTYSLIHDDLPSMDNDSMRRGKPSNHIVYGEAMAILAGDALLNRAFETIFSAKTNALPENVLAAGAKIACFAGVYGMIGGQVLDTAESEKQSSPQALTEMIDLKTGALISAACVSGCLLSGADEGKLKLAQDYATAIGRAFQIQDDILDVLGNAAVIGKNIGSDADNEKYTFVTAYGIEKCHALVAEYTQAALTAANGFDHNDFIKSLAVWLAERNY